MARRQSADAFGEATRLAPQRYSANGGRVRRFGRAARLDFRLRRCKRRSPRSPDTSLGLWIGDTRFGAVGEPVTDVPDRFLTSPSAPATFRLPPEAVCLSPRLLRLRPLPVGFRPAAGVLAGIAASAEARAFHCPTTSRSLRRAWLRSEAIPGSGAYHAYRRSREVLSPGLLS